MQTEFLILGAGVTGLAAATVLEDQAVVIEKESTPGGLVRSKCFHGTYWFDNVLHILHFKDQAIQAHLQVMLGDVLQPCPPVAWIECKEGVALYPFQLNVGGLNEVARNRCITDYAKVYYHPNNQEEASNYEAYLKATFGDAMCELFYFPYNEKLYKYPLQQIAADDILWNIHRPSFEEILQGGFQPNVVRTTYNSNAFYPRPPKDAPLRGMEILSQALAANVPHLHLNTTVTHIDLPSRTVYAMQTGVKKKFVFTNECLSTLPLPRLMKLCSNVPEFLLKEIDQLVYTKVFSVALCIRGERPHNSGHWRYYTDPQLPFTRLIFMTEFDTHNAPEDGWGLLAEITWNSQTPDPDETTLIAMVIKALYKISVLHADTEVISTHTWTADPAYVIFTPETQQIVQRCFEFLKQYDIRSLGRYGNWEYSSMFQNIKAGFNWAQQVTSKITV